MYTIAMYSAVCVMPGNLLPYLSRHHVFSITRNELVYISFDLGFIASEHDIYKLIFYSPSIQHARSAAKHLQVYRYIYPEERSHTHIHTVMYRVQPA